MNGCFIESTKNPDLCSERSSAVLHERPCEETHRGQVLAALKQVISKGRRFAVATHVRPDGDAVGSLLAATTILRLLGKTVDAYCEDPPPPGHDFLEGIECIHHSWNAAADYDTAILVDCGEFNRVGTALAEPLSRVPTLVNIDHHVSHDPFGTVAWVEPTASSTCELLYDLAVFLGVPITPALATQLYTGLLTDTGSFRFSNTTRRVLAIATELVGHGAQPAFIAAQIYDSGSPQRLRLLAQVLLTVAFDADNRLATAELSQAMFRDTGATRADAESFINHLRSVRSVYMAALFREEEDGIVHVSLRSKDPVDVAAFARRYGGGGHRHAAAFRTRGVLAQVRAAVTQKAREYLNSHA
ncbi:DHH family phosphoesterase [Desulfosoma caldarium]|uniref:Phosphoesterase RecJ-like protein n=1 Tax=Desulfosoma caldarium TaxID=610254 RepID=A0A3N1ULC2_9BACT|nr:bifunctional oligoribonuclease/PAP phosphatase NrnA [Desulfosoma caldarium]ROQ90199.1 phosphoesterase RecJ-like protein [Desulfosoma caldarium]